MLKQAACCKGSPIAHAACALNISLQQQLALRCSHQPGRCPRVGISELCEAARGAALLFIHLTISLYT